MTILSITSESLIFAFMAGWASAVDFTVKGWVRRGVLAISLPLPLNSHIRSISGNAWRTLSIKSKLGLLRPLKIWEILERWTDIFSANAEADNP